MINWKIITKYQHTTQKPINLNYKLQILTIFQAPPPHIMQIEKCLSSHILQEAAEKIIIHIIRCGIILPAKRFLNFSWMWRFQPIDCLFFLLFVISSSSLIFLDLKGRACAQQECFYLAPSGTVRAVATTGSVFFVCFLIAPYVASYDTQIGCIHFL